MAWALITLPFLMARDFPEEWWRGRLGTVKYAIAF